MCTTMIFTKGATTDGSMVVAHSDDDELSDQRVIRVPAAKHPEGALRPILPESYNYPRLVAKDRGPYYDTPGWPITEPIGNIPQAEHTYAYFDGNYGIMNERNLMMGECTNGARYTPKFVTAEMASATGKHIRIFYSSELSRIALERCTSAREAIEQMGDLIDAYGYYGEGETLLVADEDEAWVFEMCALPDETHHSAWVAQRVPDGEIFVTANIFRIRDVSGHDPDQIHSDHLLDDLQAVGWWNPAKGPLDWLPAVSEGEYNHPYYSLRRIWRVMDRVNPDLGLSPWVEGTYTRDYPFSVPVCRKVTMEQIFDLYRDHYEGTEFDLTKGVAAGPYGDPHRFVGPYDGKQNEADNGKRKMAGAWERSISVFYMGYAYALQVRPSVPEPAKGLMWFAPDVAYTSVFAPFYARCSNLPESYQIGNPRELDRKAAWWVFDFVANWSRLNFQRMTQVDILPLQRDLEAQSLAAIREADDRVTGVREESVNDLTKCGQENAAAILQRWSELGDELIAKYSDGYINRPPDNRKDAIAIGYPTPWLSHTDYAAGPISYTMPIR